MATLADLPKLEAGAKEFYSSSRFLERFDIGRFCQTWRILIESDTGAIFVDDRNGLISGAMGGFFHQDIYSDLRIAEEMFWFTRPEHRGAGVRLYKAFEDWARLRHADRIQMVHLLDSMPDKIEAFYRRIGFEPIETRYAKRLN